ncbi:MAG: hypothetical protein QOF61_996, partial [Acidobacteriota bacterium]|nr:hypothetical protein [Acidobacteriota bacterium]
MRRADTPPRNVYFSTAARAIRFARVLVFVLLAIASPATVGFVSASAQTNQRTPVQREIDKQQTRLASTEAEDRRDAVTRLGAMSRPDASRAAIPGLSDASPIVRATTARAILSLPAEEAARLLLPLLRDKKEFVR